MEILTHVRNRCADTPKADQRAEICRYIAAWNRERKPQVPGAVADYVLTPDDAADVWMVAIFSDKDAYRANAEDPEQDRGYRRLRELLEADPVWHDGEISEG